MVIRKSSKNRWLFFFFIACLSPIVENATTEILKWDTVSSILSIVDELFVLSLLLASIFVYKIMTFSKSELYLILFWTVGLFSGLLLDVSYITLFLGLFSTSKAIIIFLCFKRFDFTYDEIIRLIKWICTLYFFVLLFDLIELFYPELKNVIGYNPEKITERTRAGLRTISGLLTATHATLLGTFFYFAFTYYLKKNLFYRYSSAWIVLATVKIKDVFGFVMSVLLVVNKKLKTVNLIIIAIIFYGCFIVYSIMLPEHYATYFNDENSLEQARPALYYTSSKIAIDYFPFGVGFGRFASPTSQQIVSPIYKEYGIDYIYGLSYSWNSRFMADTFWPMILGETGIIGLILYIFILYRCFAPYLRAFFRNTKDIRFLLPSVLFLFCLISSVAKPVFSGPPHSFIVWGIAGIFYSFAFKRNIYEKEL